MNIKYSPEAQLAFNSANDEIKKSANSLLGTYAAYINRHSLPGKSTLKNISKSARDILGLPAGTQIFITIKENQHDNRSRHNKRSQRAIR